MQATFRNAREQDLPDLVRIARRAILSGYRPVLGEKAVEQFIESGTSDRYVRDNVDKATVVEVDGQVVGFCVCRANLLDLMMVDPAWQRRGLGAHLLRECEASLFKNFDVLTLESFEDNEPANRLYSKHGWKPDHIFDDTKTGVRKIFFTKKKAPASSSD